MLTALTMALAETLREVGEAPEGILYVALMDKCSLEEFNACLDILINAKLIERTSYHLIRWIGPRIEGT